MSPSHLGSVEVRDDTASPLWYSGHIIDVKSDTAVVVGFEDDVWPSAQYRVANIRKPPKLSVAELENFNPEVGEEVELHVGATEHAPAGWGVATVQNLKHDFYFVALVSAAEESNIAIVEKDMLRPKTSAAGLPGGSLKQETLKLPKELEAWMSTGDAIECFEHIEEQAGLIFIQTLKSELRLVGDAKTIPRARMLLQLHIKHQHKIHNFQETLEKQLNALEKKRTRIEGTGYKHSVEFHVENDVIGRIIGKGGEAIRALQEKHDVSVFVLPQEEEGGQRTLRIFGNSTDNIEEARAEIDYVEEVMVVDPKMRSWILGQNGKTIQTFKECNNLIRAYLDGEHLLLVGTRHNVEDAKIMFETHFMYYNVFHQMDEEMQQVLSELREYGETDAAWEWGWNRDDGDDYSKGWKGGERKGMGGKGGKGGCKGKSNSGKKGKDWDEPQARAGKGKSGKAVKGAAGKAGGRLYAEEDTGGKGAGKWQHAEEGVNSVEKDKEGAAREEPVQRSAGKGAPGHTSTSATGARTGRAKTPSPGGAEARGRSASAAGAAAADDDPKRDAASSRGAGMPSRGTAKKGLKS